MEILAKHRLAALVPIAAVIVLLPLLFPSAYYYRVAALVLIFALAATGLNLLMGFAGQVSLGHAGFVGIGGYAVAIGPTHLGLPPWLCVAGGGRFGSHREHVRGANQSLVLWAGIGGEVDGLRRLARLLQRSLRKARRNG